LTAAKPPAFVSSSSGDKQKINAKFDFEFDSQVSSDEVQSPSFSDISYDSTPVADQKMLCKSFCLLFPFLRDALTFFFYPTTQINHIAACAIGIADAARFR